MDIEWLILADGAQVVNGKLYLLGGGRDAVTVATDRFPAQHRCALAAAFRVPWNETNQPNNIEIEIVLEDGQESLVKIAGPVEVGRPAGLPRGQDQRAQLVVELELSFPKPGTYTVIGRVEGQELKRVPFTVVPNPMLALRPGSPVAP